MTTCNFIKCIRLTTIKYKLLYIHKKLFQGPSHNLTYLSIYQSEFMQPHTTPHTVVIFLIAQDLDISVLMLYIYIYFDYCKETTNYNTLSINHIKIWQWYIGDNLMQLTVLGLLWTNLDKRKKDNFAVLFVRVFTRYCKPLKRKDNDRGFSMVVLFPLYPRSYILTSGNKLTTFATVDVESYTHPAVHQGIAQLAS